MNTKALNLVIELLEKTVCGVDKPVYTCTQFLMTLILLRDGPMTQRELAQKVMVDDSTILRGFRKLGPGPEGSGCLKKVGGKLVVSDHVREVVEKLLDTY